jgi:uncharacterized protein YybS (DUF2232 family)
VAVLAAATQYIPLIGLATVFLCPLPLAVLVIRHGFAVAAIASVASILVAIAIAGPIVGLSILVAFAPLGLVLGLGGRLGWPAARAVGLASITSALSTAASYLGLLGGGRLSMDEMAKALERSIATAGDLYSRLGIPKEQLEAATRQMQAMVPLFPFLMPMMIVVGGVTTAWLNYEVARRVLSRFKYHLPPLPPIRAWRLPSWTVWLFPISYLAMALASRPGAPRVLQSVGVSAVVTLQVAFSAQGLVAAWMIIGNYGFGRVAQIITIAMAFAVPALGLVAFLLGVIDSTMKVRERWGVPKPSAPRTDP